MFESVTVRAVVSVVLWRGRRETLLVGKQISLADVERGTMVERLELRERGRPDNRRVGGSDSLAEALLLPARKPVHTGIRVSDEETDRDTPKLFGTEIFGFCGVHLARACVYVRVCVCVCVCVCV